VTQVLTRGAANASPFTPRREAEGVRSYAVYGGLLRSDLDFPELVPREGTRHDWRLRVIDCAPPVERDLVLRGERQIGVESYRLWSGPSRLRLEYSHAGCFDITRQGSVITWYRRPDALEELVRNIVLGPALALSLDLAGLMCLHGSAVAIDGQAVVFLGPKYHGKSTLATAMTAAGARLLGDDLVPIELDGHPRVRPGVASVRLWNDAASALAVDRICESVAAGVKTTASGFARDALALADVPVRAVYLLSPERPGGATRPCWRTRLPVGAATIAIAQQAKLPDALIGLRAAGDRLRAAAALASAVPVFMLHTVRDFTQLDAVTRQIADWSREPEPETTVR
jgi:hypothetical protein